MYLKLVLQIKWKSLNCHKPRYFEYLQGNHAILASIGNRSALAQLNGSWTDVTGPPQIGLYTPHTVTIKIKATLYVDMLNE